MQRRIIFSLLFISLALILGCLYSNKKTGGVIMEKGEKQKIAARENNIKLAQEKGQCCGSSETANKELSGNRGVKLLNIKWQRLISEGETCPRCGSTEKEVDKAVSALSQSLAALGIEVRLEKTELSLHEFKKNPLQSNRIWINNRPLEDWIEGRIDQSPCCDVCGPSECRTLEVGGKVYEAIPAQLIIKAGLIAASELVNKDKNKNSSGCGSSCK